MRLSFVGPFMILCEAAFTTQSVAFHQELLSQCPTHTQDWNKNSVNQSEPPGRGWGLANNWEGFTREKPPKLTQFLSREKQVE